MVNLIQGGLWSDRTNWPVIGAAVDARSLHHGQPGHTGVCVLDDPDTTSRDQMLKCSLALPSCQTMLGLCLREEIDILVEDNTSNPVSRRALIVEGEAAFGKTTTTMFEVMRRSRAAIQTQGPLLDGVRERIPWVYVEVGAGYGYRDIAASVLHFVGWPTRGRATAASLMAELRYVLPRLGVEGIVVDDAHNLRGAPDSSRIDGLKNLLTGVPASLVFIGLAPMSDSALLNGAGGGLGSSVQQIARRSKLLPADLGISAGDRRTDWDRLIASLVTQLHLPSHDGAAALANRELSDRLWRASRGLFGVAYDLLRQSARDTIRGTQPTFEAAVSKRLDAATPVPEPARKRQHMAARKRAGGRQRPTSTTVA